VKKTSKLHFIKVVLFMAETDTHILALASQIVTAHVSHNTVGSGAVVALIRSVYNTLSELCTDDPPTDRGLRRMSEIESHDHNHHHAHPAKMHTHGSKSSGSHIHPEYGQTVFADHLICMEDGLSMKMLKRHLQTVHGMTPEEYRAKWDLPPDYPMVASEYARLRSSLALESGLGLKPDARSGRRGRSGR
jgi:predicted transcriptional regulator